MIPLDTVIDRKALATRVKLIIRRGSTLTAEVALYIDSDDKIVVKDCSTMAPWARTLYGRRVRNREVRIYRYLTGVQGIPAFRGEVDHDAFAIEYIDGQTMGRHVKRDCLVQAITRLEVVLEAMHNRRIVHLDLKQKRNVIVKTDGSIAIIDFESAIHISRGFLRNLLFDVLKRRDRAGLMKFKAKYTPHLLTAHEERVVRREKLIGSFWPVKRFSSFLRRLIDTFW